MRFKHYLLVRSLRRTGSRACLYCLFLSRARGYLRFNLVKLPVGLAAFALGRHIDLASDGGGYQRRTEFMESVD